MVPVLLKMQSTDDQGVHSAGAEFDQHPSQRMSETISLRSALSMGLANDASAA